MKEVAAKTVTVEYLNEFFLKDQMAGHLGLKFTDIGPDAGKGRSISGELKVTTMHARPGGIMNGSTSLFLIETLASVAGSIAVDQKTQNVFGLEINCNHLKQVSIGETITACASPVHLGRSTQVWNVEIVKAGALVCVGRATLFVAQRK